MLSCYCDRLKFMVGSWLSLYVDWWRRYSRSDTCELNNNTPCLSTRSGTPTLLCCTTQSKYFSPFFFFSLSFIRNCFLNHFLTPQFKIDRIEVEWIIQWLQQCDNNNAVHHIVSCDYGFAFMIIIIRSRQSDHRYCSGLDRADNNRKDEKNNERFSFTLAQTQNIVRSSLVRR